MPTSVPTLEERQYREYLRTRAEAMMAPGAVSDLVRSTLGPSPTSLDKARGPPTLINMATADPMAKNVDDDNVDLIDEKGALAVTLEDGGDALDCGVCYLPLRPPILQCFNGHVMCSSCRNKLEATGNGKCHVCREEIDSDDSRCYAMERVVESIRVPCPNAAHGCAARLTYYDRSSHRRACPHARYSCSSHGCGFVGSVGALLDHVASVHTNNNKGMQQFWTEELSSFMARMKLAMSAAATSGHQARLDGGRRVSVDKA